MAGLPVRTGTLPTPGALTRTPGSWGRIRATLLPRDGGPADSDFPHRVGHPTIRARNCQANTRRSNRTNSSELAPLPPVTTRPDSHGLVPGRSSTSSNAAGCGVQAPPDIAMRRWHRGRASARRSRRASARARTGAPKIHSSGRLGAPQGGAERSRGIRVERTLRIRGQHRPGSRYARRRSHAASAPRTRCQSHSRRSSQDRASGMRDEPGSRTRSPQGRSRHSPSEQMQDPAPTGARDRGER